MYYVCTVRACRVGVGVAIVTKYAWALLVGRVTDQVASRLH